MTQTRQVQALIIGAGLAGLMAAERLRAAGLRVLLVDKGTSVGGRLATRRIGTGLADHGAQFFTVRAPEFQRYVEEWLHHGLVFEWARGWNDGSLATQRDGHPRYAVRGGMNMLAKHLAHGLDVLVDSEIAAVEQTADGWRVRDRFNATYSAQALLLTPPVPQSLRLLDAGSVTLAPDDRAALERIVYAPCIAAMIRLSADSGLPVPGGVQRPGANLSWIADNHRKGISPDAFILTAQASAGYSRQLYDLSDEQIEGALRVDIMPFVRDGVQIVDMQIKRWRYSQPEVLHEARLLQAAGLPPLVFAGDAFGEARVEGAALSGLAAGTALAEMLG